MNDVTMYTTSVCPFCIAAKQLLKSKKIEYREIELGADPHHRQRLMEENGGWRTVPMIFINDKFIGGFTELRTLSSNGGLA
ncbi:MAG: glutaredoxin [Thermoanaerobaculales bacterium]|nr:glutaredoxin [Thermoanaerobaculales bacterium]